jgi:hypothetical protein
MKTGLSHRCLLLDELFIPPPHELASIPMEVDLEPNPKLPLKHEKCGFAVQENLVSSPHGH